MSWKVEEREDGKYRIWSTQSDAWITEWVSREEAIRFYHDSALVAFKKNVIKQYITFPQHWADMKGNPHHPVGASTAYSQWLNELSSKDGEERLKFVDETYDKVMKYIEGKE